METDDDILDREDVERIAHEVIGRQFRLPALFSVVLLIIGFVLGHYVASRHVRDITDRLEARIARLDAAMHDVEKTESITTAENPFEAIGNAARRDDSAAGRLSNQTSLLETGNPVSISMAEELSPEPPAFVSSRGASQFRLSGLNSVPEIQESSGLTRSSLQEAVARLKKEVADEREKCLKELAPHVEQKSRIPAATVSAVVEEIFAAEGRRLTRVIDEASGTAAVELHDLSATFRSDEDRSARMFPPLQSTDIIGEENAAAPLPPGSRAATRSDELAGNRYFPAPRAVIGSYFFTPSKGAKADRGTNGTSAGATTPSHN